MNYKFILLHRSHAKLQKLGEQLDLDPAGTGNEDDAKIYALNGDIVGGYVSPLNDGQMNSSPHRKRPRVNLETHDASNQGSRSYAYEQFNSYSLLEIDATLSV